MKLTILFLLAFTPLLLCSTNYLVLGELPRYSYKSFYPSVSGKHCTYYLSVSDLPHLTGIYFKVTLSSGTFENGPMYMGGSNVIFTEGTEMNLGTPIYSYYYDSKSNSYYFVIYKVEIFNYYYIAPPPPASYSEKSTITVMNTRGPVYYVLGDISKFSYKTFNPYTKGIYGLYCIKLADFLNEKNIFLRTTITNGEFAYGFMYYGGSNSKLSEGTEVTLENSVSYSTYSSNTYYSFSVPKINYNYLYVAPPPPYVYASNTQMTVHNTYSASDIEYTASSGLSPFGSISFYPYSQGNYRAFYIDTYSFPKDQYIYFKVTISSSGIFEHKYMFYYGFNDIYNEGSIITLYNNNVYYDSFSSSSYIYYFIVPKPNTRYLYFAPPPIINHSASTQITIKNEYGATFKVLGDLSKFSDKTYIPSDQGVNCVYYINTENFQKEKNLYFNMTIDSGVFEQMNMNFYMRYGEFNTGLISGSTVTLYNYVTSSNTTFEVTKSTIYKYLYVAPPPLSSYNSKTKITVYNTLRRYKIAYDVLGEISKYSNDTYNPNVDGQYCVFYVKTENYQNDNKIYFKASINHGTFENTYMFYGGLDEELDNATRIILPNSINQDSSGTYCIPKPSQKYLYFAPPLLETYYSDSIITVHNVNSTSASGSTSNSVAIGVGVGVSVAVVIIIVVVVIVVRKKNENLNSNAIETNISEPIHLTAS